MKLRKSNFLQQYLLMSLLLIIAVLLFKTTESVFFLHLKVNFWDFIKMLFCYISVFSFFVVLLLPCYIIFRIINKKLSIIIISLFFATLLLLEVGFSVYAWESGVLLGTEFILRPLYESIAAILNTVSLFWVIFIILSVMFFFIAAAFLLINKLKLNKIWSIVFVAVFIVFSFFIFSTKNIASHSNSLDKKPFLTIKTLYFIEDCLHYVKTTDEIKNDISFDKQKIEDFIAEHPDWIIPDIKYPLERKDNIQNTLAPYFEKTDTPPNIVFILCESLSRGVNLPQDDGVSFTPFLDSLSKNSLYWTNCMSISVKTFGILPATTGSLPVGSKGFQFGIMPDHNTLFSVLQNNNYQSNVFHSEISSYDSKQEFLLAQRITNYPNFYKDFKENQTDYNGKKWWGYHDSILFDKTIKELNKQAVNNPLFNVIVTISTHDELTRNNPLFKTAYIKTDKIYRKILQNHSLSNEKKKYYNDFKDRAAGFVYLDICLQQFFNEYAKRDDFKNTIFVITGDHSSGLRKDNGIKQYHVPLIIYSPLIKKHKEFHAVVSHNDITPALVALIRDNYHLNTPKFVSWVGTCLDTSSYFVSNQKHLCLSYSSGPDWFLYNDLFLYYNHVYNINNKFEMSEIYDTLQINNVKQKFQLYKYIHEYVYKDNKLTAHPIFSNKKYELLLEKNYIDEFVMNFMDTTKYHSFKLLEEQKIDGKYEEIKITVSADVKLDKNFSDANYGDAIGLLFECIGDNIMPYNTQSSEKIIRYMGNDKINSDKWYKLNAIKNFQVTDVSNIKISIDTYKSSGMTQEKSVWKNIHITIEGLK